MNFEGQEPAERRTAEGVNAWLQAVYPPQASRCHELSQQRFSSGAPCNDSEVFRAFVVFLCVQLSNIIVPHFVQNIQRFLNCNCEVMPPAHLMPEAGLQHCRSTAGALLSWSSFQDQASARIFLGESWRVLADGFFSQLFCHQRAD